MTDIQPSIGIDCYVRASSTGGATGDVVETLRGYAATGVVDDLSVRTWPDRVVLRPATRDADPVERFEKFRAWADRHGVSIVPPFAVRERATLVDDPAAVLVVPALCLAVRVDGELASVVPHRTGTTEYAVDDLLADLEAGTVRSGVPSGRPAGVGDRTDDAAGATRGTRTPDRCPACGGGLATGQGLYACRSCPWSGVVAGTGLLPVATGPKGEAVESAGSLTGDPAESDAPRESEEPPESDDPDRRPTHPSV